MTKITVTCRCGSTLTLTSPRNWKVRDMLLTCQCGIGWVINPEGVSEKTYDFGSVSDAEKRASREEAAHA